MDLNLYCTEEEMRKQDKHFAHKLVVAGQEMPDSSNPKSKHDDTDLWSFLLRAMLPI